MLEIDSERSRRYIFPLHSESNDLIWCKHTNNSLNPRLLSLAV